MPRKPRKSRILKQRISPALRSWLETGERPKANYECFMILKSPDGLRAAWERCREEIMADRKRERRKGKPWASRVFDKVGK